VNWTVKGGRKKRGKSDLLARREKKKEGGGGAHTRSVHLTEESKKKGKGGRGQLADNEEPRDNIALPLRLSAKKERAHDREPWAWLRPATDPQLAASGEKKGREKKKIRPDPRGMPAGLIETLAALAGKKEEEGRKGRGDVALVCIKKRLVRRRKKKSLLLPLATAEKKKGRRRMWKRNGQKSESDGRNPKKYQARNRKHRRMQRRSEKKKKKGGGKRKKPVVGVASAFSP